QVHAPPLPQPAPVGPVVQAAADGTGHVGEERLRQTAACLAVGAGLGGARTLPARQAVGGQAGGGGAAGVVGTQGLPPEDPQRDQRGEDAVQAAGDGGQRLGDGLLGQDGGERQVPVLKEVPSQGVQLVAERGVVARAHGGDLLAGDGVVVRLHL